jgi:starvation-inducible DNA-binding protein
MVFTHNMLSENIRVQSVELLNRHLAAAIDPHAQLTHAHWNVRRPGFVAIHELFDKVTGEVDTYADQMAERAGARGTFQTAMERSFLTTYTLDIADPKEHIFVVAATLAAFGQSAPEASDLAAGFGDANTADLFTHISRGLDQQIWLVESHIDPEQ